MSNSDYKETVENLSVEIFNIHTSMLDASEENEKLVLKVKMLETRNEELELACVGVLDLKHKIEYLENKYRCNKEVEFALRTKLSEVEETLKAYKIAANASKIEQDKNLNINKTCIGLGYEDLKKVGKKHVKVDDTELVQDQEAPFVVQHVFKPMYRQFIYELVDEDLLKINVELFAEDEKIKEEDKNKLPKKIVRIASPEVKPKTEIGNIAQKKKVNGNGKVGVNKKNVNVVSPTSARKVCNNCNSTGHLTHASKMVKVEQSETSSVPIMPTLNNIHLPCGKVGCMPCAFNIMSAYKNLMNASSSSCINNNMIDSNKNIRAKTVSPPKVRKDTPVSKPKVTLDKAKTKDKRKVNVPDEYVKVAPVVTPVNIPKPLGPKQVWVPKK